MNKSLSNDMLEKIARGEDISGDLKKMSEKANSALEKAGFSHAALQKFLDSKDTPPEAKKVIREAYSEAIRCQDFSPEVSQEVIKRAIDKIKASIGQAAEAKGAEAQKAGTPAKEIDAATMVDVIIQNKLKGKDLFQMTDENLEYIYNLAYNLYKSGKYEDAHCCFQFLCLCDTSMSKYWMGLGACRQMMKKYEEAIFAYAFAIVLDPDFSPPSAFYASQCFLSLGRLDEADQALESVSQIAGGQKKYADLSEKAKKMRTALQKRHQTKPETEKKAEKK